MFYIKEENHFMDLIQELKKLNFDYIKSKKNEDNNIYCVENYANKEEKILIKIFFENLTGRTHIINATLWLDGYYIFSLSDPEEKRTPIDENKQTPILKQVINILNNSYETGWHQQINWLLKNYEQKLI